MKIVLALVILSGFFIAKVHAGSNLVDPSNPSLFDILDIHLTKDSFAQIKKRNKGIKLIKAPTQSSDEGEGEGHFDSFCMVGQDGAAVTFTSNYSYSGSEIAEYVLERKSKMPSKLCTISEKIRADLVIPIGIRFNMSKKDIEKKFGAAKRSSLTINSMGVEVKKDLFVYHFEDPSQVMDGPKHDGKEKAKKRFSNSLDLGFDFDSQNNLNTIYVSFSSEPEI